MVETKKNYNILNDCRGMYEEEIIDTLLDSRGINDPNSFLHPTEEYMLPLDSMTYIGVAAERVDQAIKNDEWVGVLWDTDLDGVSSGTIITRYLQNFLTTKMNTYIDYGKKHGLKGQDLKKFEMLDLLIIVDSLDNSVEQYKKLAEAGVDIIILDHHAIKPEIPYDDYAILVSSQRDYDNPALSGAGVTWKFCKYLDKRYSMSYADELMDLAACGLVADMVDMTVMENRYIVYKGLQKIYNPAVKKIVGSFPFNSTAISFSIAPLVNAANRIGKNEDAMFAFMADENKEVLKYVKVLKSCKEQQNEEVERLLPDVIAQCDLQSDKKMVYAFIDTKFGIAGLLANKLLEKYQKPILVLKNVGDTYSGSMRAVGVDDFRKICNDSGLAQADGHELASGIKIEKSNFDDFIFYIEDNLPELSTETTITVDAQIDVSDITRKLIDGVKELDFVSGTGFKQFRFFVDGIDEYEIGQMSDYKHLVVKPNDFLQFIKWNFNGSFDYMEDHSMMGDELEAVVTLDSGWLGRKFVLKAVCDSIEEVD